MYCYKCGKFIETDDTLCPDCKAQEEQTCVHPAVVEYTEQQEASQEQTCQQTCQPEVYQQVVYNPQPISLKKPSNGFGVASMVLGIVALIMSVIALANATPSYAGVVAVVYLLAQPAIIIALVNGIKAIVVFIKACKNKQPKPIAGFVMGIIGLTLMGMAMLYLFMAVVASEVIYY